jgi:glycosyltransferase involved in cell wall biosynthesis
MATVSAKSSVPLPVSVILPAYNEVEGIGIVVAEVAAILTSVGVPHEVIVVDDGSTDGSAEAAARAGAQVLSLPENRGYGGRSGSWRRWPATSRGGASRT